MIFRRPVLIVIISIITLGIFGCGSSKMDVGDRVSYTVKRATEKIYVDGNIFEADWDQAEEITPFVFPWYKEGNKDQSSVRILWDDNYLYFLWRCEDEHISAHRYQRNTATCLDDCAEMFISPNLDESMWYTNYEINCIGTWLVGAKTDENKGTWEPEGLLVGRSHVGTINNEEDIDSHWILEIAIPFEHFRQFKGQIPPEDGDMWGLNLDRCGGDVNEQFSQWTASKTPNPNYHRPEDFGRIIFSSEKVR